MRQATRVIVKIIGPHNHNKSAIEASVRAIKNTIKDSAVNTLERPAQIFNRVLIGVEEAVQAKLDKSASRQTVKRKRKNATNQIAAEIGMGFVFPEAAKNYAFAQNDPELFLLGDELDENGNRLLVFGRTSNRNWSRNMKVVFVDGTFKITPAPFHQVYVILAERGGYVFPVLYALLPNKSQATYEKLFRITRRIWPDFIPSSVSIDFEMAVISALEVVFPESDVWGCFFHLVQNMIKKLNVAGLKGRYETEPDFAVKCRMITAMAFVKPEDLMPVFAELEELLPEELDPILDWFQTYYIGFVNRRGNMVVPMFAHSLWNVYERTLNGNHRTNNYAEAANHRIQMELDVCHPGFWNFINCLKNVQQGRDQKYLQWQAGRRPKGKRTVYKEEDARILRIRVARKGSSNQAITKYVTENFDVASNVKTHINNALKKGVEDKLIVQIHGVGATGSFRLATSSKKRSKSVTSEASDDAPPPKKLRRPDLQPPRERKGAEAAVKKVAKKTGPAKSMSKSASPAKVPKSKTATAKLAKSKGPAPKKAFAKKE
uniref:H15 domain-containing protein n=1 Tax=Ditylenchus dipsaci TaxID=166011 RepID=A0A915E455_9BILA